MKVVILAAGVGSRIGKPLPKCFNKLPSGKNILETQIEIVNNLNIKEVVVVVGFKKELIMERYPDLLYCYNPHYHVTNTSKSLKLALELLEPDDVVWLNGDVVLEKEVLVKVMNSNRNAIGVNKSNCGDEEIKYKTNNSGKIIEISKKVRDAEGEAVGINKITKEDFKNFIKALKDCDSDDYFEKGIEICINREINFYPVDISKYKCIEVDFEDDLKNVWETFKE